MSDSMDKFFRDQQANVPPATPPPGQWQQIRKGKLIVEPVSKRPVPYWWLALGLCLGLGLGVPVGAYFFSAQCPANSVKEVVVGVTTAKGGEEKLSGSVPVPLTDIVPAAAPEKPLASVIGTSADLQASTRSAILNNEAAKPADEVSDLLRLDVSIKSVSAEENTPKGEVVTKVDSLNTAVGRPKEEGLAKLANAKQAPVRSTRFGSLQSTLVRAAALAEVEPMKIKQRRPTPLARWEFGLHITPWRSSAAPAVRTYSESDPGLGLSPRSYEFDGQDVSLYSTNTLNPDLPRRFQLKVVSFEAARQFQNGLRVGVGMAWVPRHLEGLVNGREYLNAQLLSGEWARSYTIERQTVYGSVQLDYTFMRRRRFRPYLGLSLRTFVYGDFNVQERLFERESGRSETINSIYSVNQIDLNSLEFLPRAGFQYDLSGRISVGLEIVPGVGIGGRWKL